MNERLRMGSGLAAQGMVSRGYQDRGFDGGSIQ
jgi:hypothetical protein